MSSQAALRLTMTQVTRISLKGLLGATVAPFLKERGFRPKHLFFIPEVAECWQVVEFQNRKFNTATEVELTVKLGIASKRLFEFFGISQEATTIDECHWYER